MGRIIEKRFLSVPELAEYMSVSEDAIRKWVRKDQIPFKKFGRSVRFDMHHLENWFKRPTIWGWFLSSKNSF